jgi:hypothetical protein
MDWWEDLGVALQFMPDTPALAFDMTTSGPRDNAFRYTLAYNMQNSPAGLDVYPTEGMAFPGQE